MPSLSVRTGGAWSAPITPGKLSVHVAGGTWTQVRKGWIYSGGAWIPFYDALSGGIIIAPAGTINVSGGTAVLSVTNRLAGYRIVGTAVSYESGTPVNSVSIDQATNDVSLPLVSFFANRAVFTLHFYDPTIPLSGPDSVNEAFF